MAEPITYAPDPAADMDLVTREVFERWALVDREPVAFASFDLRWAVGREAFLEEYLAWGTERLFEAVAHIWTSLAPPKATRCTLMGVAAGTGGTGKLALVHLLRRLVPEALGSGIEMPHSKDFGSAAEWHAAAMLSMKADHDHFDLTITTYAHILNGDQPGSNTGSTVIKGPWR